MEGGERPAEERPRETIRETPAPERTEMPAPETAPRRTHRRREPTRDPVAQGERAAMVLFAIAVALEVAAMAWVRLSHMPSGDGAGVFVGVGGLIFLGGILVLPVVAIALPRAARGSFWATSTVCAALAAILWGVTCGLAGAWVLS